MWQTAWFCLFSFTLRVLGWKRFFKTENTFPSFKVIYRSLFCLRPNRMFYFLTCNMKFYIRTKNSNEIWSKMNKTIKKRPKPDIYQLCLTQNFDKWVLQAKLYVSLMCYVYIHWFVFLMFEVSAALCGYTVFSSELWSAGYFCRNYFYRPPHTTPEIIWSVYIWCFRSPDGCRKSPCLIEKILNI